MLNFDFIFKLKHILSNESVTHVFLEDYIFCVKASKDYGGTLPPTSFVNFR